MPTSRPAHLSSCFLALLARSFTGSLTDGCLLFFTAIWTPRAVKEFGKYDKDPQKWIKQYTGQHPKTKQLYTCDIGFERFMATEIFFNPEIRDGAYKRPLPKMVDDAIQACPIDARKPLYNNIVLSGGSSMFKDFGRRLQRDVKKHSDGRLERSYELSGVKTSIDVNVVTHQFQRYAVWFGGALTDNAR